MGLGGILLSSNEQLEDDLTSSPEKVDLFLQEYLHSSLSQKDLLTLLSYPALLARLCSLTVVWAAPHRAFGILWSGTFLQGASGVLQ